jgi:hypothetical protein
MKIAVLGAPGAGKTDFAHELAALLIKQEYDRFWVLDDYVDDLRKRTGQEYGHFGNHIDDLQVVFKRREWELGWRHANTITVGTVLDSAIHCFARTEEAVRTRKELGLQAERLRTIAGVFGLLYTDTWDYDYAFLLPYDGDDRMSRFHSTGLVELLNTYRAPVLSFNEGISDDEKAPTAARAIVALEAEQLPATKERGVRSGSEASKAERDSTESVPDVPEQGRAPDDA